MALKKKKFVVDNDGFVTEEKTWREKLSDFSTTLFTVIAVIARVVEARVKLKWECLGKAPKPISQEEVRNQQFKDTRDNIAYMVTFVVAVIAMWKWGSIPTLWMATGCVEALAVVCESLLLREAVRKNDKELYKAASKAGGKIVTRWVVLIILQTILSWAVLDGKLGSFPEYFPFMNTFAEWMISEVNKAFEVINFFRG